MNPIRATMILATIATIAVPAVTGCGKPDRLALRWRVLPAGYEVGKDGTGKYRWKDEDGFVTGYSYHTRAGAVRRAWGFYDFMRDSKAESQIIWESETTNNTKEVK